MDIVTLERSKQHWQFAADSLPQLICLLDSQGRIVRANSTLQRWGLGDVFSVGGRHLHDALHPQCGDGDCYLRDFLNWGAGELAAGRQAQCDAFDPQLNRFFAIRAEPARPDMVRHEFARAMLDILAVVTFDDVTEARSSDDRLIRLNRELGDQVVRERDKRRQVESVWMRMQAIVERTASFVAMTDPAGMLIYINPAGREMLGIGNDEDISTLSALDLHAGTMREQMAAEAFPAAADSGTWTGRSTLRRRAGDDIETLAIVLAHRGCGGECEGMSMVMHDMSEWVKSEQALRQSHLELRRLSGQLIAVQENERRRIAGDLHDGIGQTLSLLQLHVKATIRQLERGDTEIALGSLHGLVPRLAEAMAEVRRLSTDLHPSSLEDLGILATLSWFFRELEAACCGIEIAREFGVRETDVPPALRVSIFRILQEAVSNIIKHAAPTRIGVRLHKCGDHLHLSIEDDGCGFDPANLAGRTYPERGFGLSSMKERAKLSGGTYELKTAVGCGTRISVVWPTLAMEA